MEGVHKVNLWNWNIIQVPELINQFKSFIADSQ